MHRTMIDQTPSLVGQQVKVQGWINTRRDHGKVTFLDIRDRSGLLQVVVVGKPEGNPEDVVEVVGNIKNRPEHLVNDKISTGSVEMEGTQIHILNVAKPLPFPIDTDGSEIKEDIRLKYRYLDLRRQRLAETMKLRSDYVYELRKALALEKFIEVETPMLTKSTKEGSRDFLVPSRLQPGKFYALPQSPQQYKQLLMVAGVEKYFQFARCVRDEDLRADRGFEHTQLDLELSFATRDDVMNTVERLVTSAVKAVGGKLQRQQFPVIDYKEAVDKYGADKFDLRNDQEKADGVLAFAWVVNFPFFKRVDTTDKAELEDGKSGWTFTHNPFSTPIPEHVEWHLKGENIDKIITNQYDLVCNGYEVGGGSIRAHQPEVLEATYRIMGYSPQQTKDNIGHMLEALSYGAPPHGGIALGIDRHVMLLAQQTSLKEAIAFPMSTTGRTAVMDGPSEVAPEQLAELGITTLSKVPTKASVFEQLKARLETLRINYEIIDHEPVFTSQQAASVRNTSLEQGAKALVLISERQPIMVVVSAATKVDTKALKKLLGTNDIRMADKDEVLKLTGVAIGAIPPFGSLFKLQTYVDLQLGYNQVISFNAGLHDKSITMKYQDYLRLEQPELGDFSKNE